MNYRFLMSLAAVAMTTAASAQSGTNAAVGETPKIPQFSVGYMDRSASPATNFYEFAAGQWLKDNPVPPDKSRWASFMELSERNTYLLHQILEDAAADTTAPPKSTRRIVGDFYRWDPLESTCRHASLSIL